MRIREDFERIEEQLLASYAVLSSQSRGRRYPEPPSTNRTCFHRDRDRIIHSKAFRRLKHKTQVFVATISDHYRSRLTHTLEVAQISRHLARMLRLNEDLSECIALAHDLGHPPFGHAGEREMNTLMDDQGGFEHNLQSLRVVDTLEKKHPGYEGLNLSVEVREGLMKHSTPWDDPDNNNLEGFTTLEAQACNIADEIAYNNHDLDDGLRSGLLSESDLVSNIKLWKDAKEKVKTQYSNLSDSEMRHLINSTLISNQVNNVYAQAMKTLLGERIETLQDVTTYGAKDIIGFSQEMAEKNNELRQYLFTNFYYHTDVYRMNKNGQVIISKLFTAFVNDLQLLPDNYRNHIHLGANRYRVCCDYIAGMTDTFARQEYNSIFGTML